MSDSVTTSVEVAVTPDVAFDVFTREIDAWYQTDPDTLPDITRTAAIRFEPHMGGRLLDVHDLATGAGRELGRVTAWEPPRRLAFVDNEGSEVEVSFEPVGGGTRVTLTHRGLDRLAPQRAKELRRSGWAALTPFYRDHIAPNARPLALAVGSLAVLFAVGGGALWLAVVVTGAPLWVSTILAVVVMFAAVIALGGLEDRLVRRRWLPSGWQYRRVKIRVMGLVMLGSLGFALHRGNLVGVGFPVMILMVWWMVEQEGPARGRSLRRPVRSAPDTSARRRVGFWEPVGLGALALGLFAIDPELAGLGMTVVLTTLFAVDVLPAIVSKRREKRALGFEPDLYLAVARRVSEENRRPQLLVHRPSKHPEYSGWYAYASEHDECARELVTWTMKDLVDHSPEAARPLREGRGDWIWDQAQRAYRPV